jgi:hypothetical protein
MNHGDGTFAADVVYVVGTEVTSVAIGDVDGDSDLDVVTANGADNDLSVLFNDGLGVLGAEESRPAGIGPSNVTLADLDGDEVLDLASSNNFSDDMVAVLNTCGAVACPPNLDGDTVVGFGDLLLMLAAWGTSGPEDIDCDGIVGFQDLLLLLGDWGPCPGGP